MSRRPPVAASSLAGVLLVTGCAQFARMSPAYLDKVEAPTPLAARIDSAMKSLEKEGFSGTVLVARGTHMVIYSGYGVADASTGTRATALTRYPLGAIANQFTATAIMQLEAEGRLDTEATASAYDRDAAPSLSKATIDELLTRSLEPVEYANGSGPATAARYRIGGPALAVGLQEQFRGKGMSYAELERVVSAAAGQPFATVRQNRILTPSKMDRTIDANLATAADQVAVGNSFARGGPIPAQGLVAPLSDLYRFHLALEGTGVLGAPGREALVAAGSNGYAPGWVVGETANGSQLLQHVGDTEGFQVWTAWLPGDDTVILLGTNSDIGWRNLASEMLLGLVAGTPGGPPLRSATR
ncbi:MAG TPA: serine hydrolase domain-containing protein [Gemmatimonadales bacterium]|nr:serine hydrolase domain-containing protein [Gemmatimonadales bacterium]